MSQRKNKRNDVRFIIETFSYGSKKTKKQKFTAKQWANLIKKQSIPSSSKVGQSTQTVEAPNDGYDPFNDLDIGESSQSNAIERRDGEKERLEKNWNSLRLELRDALIEAEGNDNTNLKPQFMQQRIFCSKCNQTKACEVDCISFECKNACLFIGICNDFTKLMRTNVCLDEEKLTFVFCDCEKNAITLCKNGLFPASPERPSIAFNIKLLRFANRLYLETQGSQEGFCKALRFIHDSQVNFNYLYAPHHHVNVT